MKTVFGCVTVLTVSILHGQEPLGGAQTPAALRSERLAVHADLPQYNFPGMSLHQQLSDAKVRAPSKGIVNWRGLDIVVTDHELLSPSASIPTLLLQFYAKQTCESDAIVIGRISSSSYHLSASGTRVYGDHLLSVDTILKDNPLKPLGIGSELVITRPGGYLVLPEGPVNMRLGAYPPFQQNASYLLFLRFIGPSSAYITANPFSTLRLDERNGWIITRDQFANVRFPELGRGALESKISDWRKSCK